MKKGSKMKTYSICVETGPCAGDHYYVIQKAITLENAIQIVTKRVKKERPWERIMIAPYACRLLDK